MNERVRVRIVGLIAGLLGFLAACSIDRRSDDYRCQDTPDCSADRVCVEQTCVLRGGGTSDAGVDAAPCPPGCTRCEQQTCFIDCTLQRCINVACPEGWKCDFVCTQDNCNDLDCSDSACAITCVGTNACRNITCGALPCDITCAGRRACSNVDCRDSCACGITCAAADACLFGIDCPAGCDGLNGGCDGLSATCNTCQ